MPVRRSIRRWISLAAVVGLLAHAGAVLLHGAPDPGARLALARLAADLGRICHGDGSAADTPAGSKGSERDCAICVGLGPAVLAGAPVGLSLTAAAGQAAGGRLAEFGDRAPGLSLRPPVRGPPGAALMSLAFKTAPDTGVSLSLPC
jgi:hypothetical protein